MQTLARGSRPFLILNKENWIAQRVIYSKLLPPEGIAGLYEKPLCDMRVLRFTLRGIAAKTRADFVTD